MKSIQLNRAVNFGGLVRKLAMTNADAGVVQNASGMFIHYPTQKEALVTSVVENAESLTLNVSKVTIPADGVAESAITYTTPETMDYYVTLNGEAYAEGEVAPVNGVISLELSTSIAGVYRIYLYRRVSNHYGVARVEAT